MTTVLYMPDGNRRFAAKKGMRLSQAYYAGGRTLKELSQFFLVEGRARVLIYHALSHYTSERTDSSLGAMHGAATKHFKALKKADFFRKNGIRFRVIDHSGKLPQSLEKAAKALSDSTLEAGEKECIVLLGYSLKEDVNQALSQKPENYESFRQKLLFPDIDLVIRPIEMRPSGGPVYAMSQAQMITLNRLNPEVSREDLERTWKEYLELKKQRIKGNPAHHK